MCTKFFRGVRFRALSRRMLSCLFMGTPDLRSAPLRDNVVNLDLVPLEDRTLFSGTPMPVGSIDIEAAEDSLDTTHNLLDYFSVDDNGGNFDLTVVENSNAELFADVRVSDLGALILDYAEHAHGSARLVVEGSNVTGNVEQLEIIVDVESVNDSPTFNALRDFTVVDESAGQTIIDLYGAFEDVEDADADLTFDIVTNSNPEIFSSIRFDQQSGLLILDHAADVMGAAELTIVARDTGGLSVGMGTSDEFRVFNRFGNINGADRPTGIDDLGMSQLNLWTHWWFFEYVPATRSFITDVTLVERFADRVTNYDGDPEIPIVLDIENEYFVNTEAGRDRFAEVLSVVNEIRPDLEVGIYRILPERNWTAPVYLARAEADESAGLLTGWNASMEERQALYDDWLSRNAFYRTEPTNESYGGTSISRMVDSINPSLYTFYRDRNQQATWHHAGFDASTDRFSVDDAPSFEDVDTVRLTLTKDGAFANGMRTYTDYYVTNVVGNTFQLSQTPGGEAIDFGPDYTGDLHVQARGPTYENLWHDPDVVSWSTYAEENIREARKYGDKPVYAWISPSFRGVGAKYLEGDFFRFQLETLRSSADGVALFDHQAYGAEYHDRQGWYTALRDFMATLDIPAATVSIELSEQFNADGLAPMTPVKDLEGMEDQALVFDVAELLANDFEFEGDLLQFTIVGLPTHGTLTDLGDGQWSYTPHADYNGPDEFRYRVSDGQQYSGITRVEIDVRPVNDPLVAMDDVIWTLEDDAVTLSLANLIGNDANSDATALTFSITSSPLNGSTSWNRDGTFDYRPNTNFFGQDVFTYRVADGQDSSEATVTVHVESKNDAPIGVADRIKLEASETLELSTLLQNDVDAEDDALSLVVLSGPRHGELQQQEDGSLVYVPNPGFAGVDRLVYQASDASVLSSSTTVEMVVRPGENQTPTARGEKFVVREDRVLKIHTDDLLANDSDPERDTLTIQPVDQPTHGKLRFNKEGDVIYTPRQNFSGVDQFSYRVKDGTSMSEEVVAKVVVQPVNDAPIARRDTYRVESGGVLRSGARGLIANDIDVEEDHMRVSLFREPQFGKLNLRSDGTFVYRPDQGFHGLDTFRYRLIDEHGAVSISHALIRVQPVA